MRPASTLLVVRDHEGHLEVLMGKRSVAASFAPGAFVFPGGVVDDSDGDQRAVEAAGGVRDPWRVAAIRETYEETGALVAIDGDVPTYSVGFWQMIGAEDRRLTLDELAYVSTWVTPTPLPRRYDTRFFLARARFGPVGPDGHELTELKWVVPSVALTEWGRGTFPAISPTVAHLDWLAGCSTTDEAWDRAVGKTFTHLVDQQVVEGKQPEGIGRAL